MPPRYSRSRGAFASTPTPDYSDKTVLGIIQGMFDVWNGAAGQGSASDDALLMGTVDVAAAAKLRGNALGREVGLRLRGIVTRGTVPGSAADEIGFLIRGSQAGFMEKAVDYAGEAVEVATLGAFNPGDAGGIEDEVMSILGL